MKKILVIGVIALFFGLAFIPSFNAISIEKPTNDSDENLVEVTVQIYRKYGIENHNVLLTKKKMNELGNLIDSIKVELDKAGTNEEISEIYDNSIISFNKLGILPENIEINEMQQLVKGENYIHSIGNSILNLEMQSIDDENNNCKVVGNVTGAIPILRKAYRVNNILWNIFEFLAKIYERFGDGDLYWLALATVGYPLIVLMALEFAYITLGFETPFCFGAYMSFGTKYIEDNGNRYNFSKGWVNTNGDNGKINWNGTFYGQIEEYPIFFINLLNELDIIIKHYIGMIGFTGIIIADLDVDWIYFEGNAKKVSLGDEPYS